MQYRIRREGDNTSDRPVDNWERDTLRDVLLEAYKEQRRARFRRNIWRGVAVVLFLILIIDIGNNSEGGKEVVSTSGAHTTVINLRGAIGDSEFGDQVKVLRESIEAAYKNKNAKTIIIRANSPGGSPVISNIAFNEIRRLREAHKNIPVYVVAREMCTSGCYYIAATVDKIYTDPSSVVGSVGVIGSGFDATGLMDKIGVRRRLKTAGSNKGMGDPFSPETPKQAEIWDAMLAGIHGESIKAVKLGRGSRLKEKENPDIFSGRIYTGIEAKQAGLIDDSGNIYSVTRDVVKTPEPVNYSPDDDFSKLLSRRLGMEMGIRLKEAMSKLW